LTHAFDQGLRRATRPWRRQADNFRRTPGREWCHLEQAHLATGRTIPNGPTTTSQENVMTIANVAQGTARGLPKELCTAQAAINLPEVQEMLRKLAQYNLGIYMPHTHEDKTGAFALLPDDVTQVESGLEVAFQSMDEITSQPDRFMPVGWFWRAGARTPLSFCRMHCETRPGDTNHYDTHTKED
jgi:hypothetical protein